MSERFPNYELGCMPINAEQLLCQRLLELDIQAEFGAARVEGIGASKPNHKALEARFGHELSQNATIVHLQFDRSGTLALKEVRIPLAANPDAWLRLRHNTRKQSMFSSIETATNVIIPNTRIEQYDFDNTLLEIYNISPPPAQKGYEQWRYQLLDRAPIWHLKEQTAIAQQFASECTSGEIILTNETHYQHDNPEEIYTKKALCNSIALALPNNSIDQFSEELSVQAEYDGSQELYITQCTPSTKGLNRQAVPLTPETYRRFTTLLSFTKQASSTIARP